MVILLLHDIVLVDILPALHFKNCKFCPSHFSGPSSWLAASHSMQCCHPYHPCPALMLTSNLLHAYPCLIKQVTARTWWVDGMILSHALHGCYPTVCVGGELDCQHSDDGDRKWLPRINAVHKPAGTQGVIVSATTQSRRLPLPARSSGAVVEVFQSLRSERMNSGNKQLALSMKNDHMRSSTVAKCITQIGLSTFVHGPLPHQRPQNTLLHRPAKRAILTK